VDEETEGECNGEQSADCLIALKYDVHDKLMTSIKRITNSCGFMLTKIRRSLPSDDYCIHRETNN
jgi:hypothetical protein